MAAVTAKLAGLEGLDALLSLPAVIEAGVAVEGEAASYALTWEWGSARMEKPGPKTALSTNPDGELAILSRQAPHGFIRVNQERYLQIAREEMRRIQFSESSIRGAMDETAERCADLIAETAPVDTGELSGSIRAVKDGDDLLRESGSALDLGVL